LGERFARFSPILLVSPPGIGKTRYARRLGQLLRTPLAHVVMNGMKSSMQLKGSSAGWGDSRPSVFVEHMLWMESANYFVLLDEIDKCSTSDYHGNPLDVLLSFLDRENAANFSDECLGTKVDLSRLSFIATANDCRRLPGPLLSRFRVIHVEPPERKHLGSVVLGTRDDRARDLNVDPRMLPLMTDEVEMLANAGRSPREVARLTLDYLMRRELESVRSMACRH
jgi:MoxR-like ATPase